MRKPDIDPKIVQSILRRTMSGVKSPAFERVSTGGSTQVYRVKTALNVVYLRFGEEPDDTFAPEAYVHDELRRRGARVPEVLFVEDLAAEIERSVMITSEVPGAALELGGTGMSGLLSGQAELLRQAGRDLALIQSMPVDGYGFIERSRPWNGTLSSRHATFDGWIEEEFTGFELLQHWFGDETLDGIRDAIALSSATLLGGPSVLAHGDFDTNHIFVERGDYMGMIDFGEIRGTDRWFDLASFIAHLDIDQSMWAISALVDGYSTVRWIQRTEVDLIGWRAIVVAARILIRVHGRGHHHYEGMLTGSIERLIDGPPLSELIGLS